MTELLVEADPSGGLTGYGIAVDGTAVDMEADKGWVVVNGECGDRSVHGVNYGFDGAAGETLSFTIKCDDRIVYAVVGASIANPPHGNGGGDFRI